nr:peptidase S41 [Syntrophales bacterium]
MKRFFRNKTIFLTLFLLLVLSLVLYGTQKVSAVDRNTYKSLKTFNEVLDMVEKNYVEEVKLQDLINGAINGMMKSLDPHSTFMTADEYKELEVETKGSFGGIGIEITIVKDVL